MRVVDTLLNPPQMLLQVFDAITVLFLFVLQPTFELQTSVLSLESTKVTNLS